MANFIENLRAVFGPQPFMRYDPIAQSRWKKADTSGLDKQVQEESTLSPEQRAYQFDEKARSARRGTKFLKSDYSLNDSSAFAFDPDVSFFSNLQIAENSDRLNKIIDDYESANGWEEKQRVIEEGYNSFPRKTTELMQWFDNFAKLTARAADPDDSFKDEPEEIAGAMRYYLNAAKNTYFRKA